MKHRLLYALFALLIIGSLALSGCQQQATEEPGGQVEQPTAVPPVSAFEPVSLEAPDCEYGGEFKKIEALDEHTVQFTLCYPDSDFANKVAFSVFSITSKEFIESKNGDSIAMSEAPVGTGPYQFSQWVRGDRIIFEANPEYWGGEPAVKTLVFRWSEQSAQRLLELQSGQVDGIDNPAPEDFATIEGDSNLALYPRDSLTIFYIGFNYTIEPFDDVKVRQAIAYGIDRQRIIDQFYAPGSILPKTFAPPAIVPGYNETASWYEFDQQKAKDLLAEAGYADGLEITLSFRNVVRGYLPTPDKVAQEIQAQLAEVGITVKINQMESTTFIDATSAGQEGFYLLGWTGDYPGATNFYDYHFATEPNKQFGPLYADIVTEIKAAGQTPDVAQRQVHYDKVNQLLKDYVVMIPVAHGVSATAFKANAEGAHASPLGNEVFSVIDNGTDQLVWMQNGEPAALWCSDETDGESLRACEQIFESLLAFEVGGSAVIPGLAESYESNADSTVWTFTLRQGVKFHDGSLLDANDVVASYIHHWDASSPTHVGRTGSFEYFGAFFGSFLNAPE